MNPERCCRWGNVAGGRSHVHDCAVAKECITLALVCLPGDGNRSLRNERRDENGIGTACYQSIRTPSQPRWDAGFDLQALLPHGGPRLSGSGPGPLGAAAHLPTDRKASSYASCPSSLRSGRGFNRRQVGSVQSNWLADFGSLVAASPDVYRVAQPGLRFVAHKNRGIPFQGCPVAFSASSAVLPAA